MVRLENALQNPMGRNVLACAFRSVAAALVQKYKLPVDPDRILFLLDRVKGNRLSGSTVFKIPPMWREVLHQLTGHDFDMGIKLWEVNTETLSPAQMAALIYHELRHIALDPETGEHVFHRHHDMEDWAELVPFGDWEKAPERLPNIMESNTLMEGNPLSLE